MTSKSELGSIMLAITYVGARIISCLFLLATLLVYFLLLKRQNIHGWTLMSYCLSLFFLMFVFRLQQFPFLVGQKGWPPWSTLCVHRSVLLEFCKFSTNFTSACWQLFVFPGIAFTFFFLCTFCCMTMINFDLWWTLRKFKAGSSGSKSIKRFILYATVSLLTPTVFVVVATALDSAYG